MNNLIVVRSDLPLGTWQGLGGAISEATAYNFAKLEAKKQQEFLNAYYSKDGLDYRWGRISIGSNDFCLKPYEYTTKTSLDDFSINHDKKWVIPLIKKTLQKKSLQLLASPWSPPECLKLTFPGRLGSILKPWRYATYAEYLRKWLDSYAEQGIKINYITPQNEPLANQIWESCYFTYRGQKKLVYRYLAPALSGLDTQIFLWDHNKSELAKTASKLLRDSDEPRIAGICYHWYDGTFPSEMWRVRQKYPNVALISSEMSCGFSPFDECVWQKDANLYITELFHDINTGACAFIDWNMLLDYHGGPTYCKNYLKSPIILNETGEDFILTPIYKTLLKFTRLFPAGSEVVRCDYNSKTFVAIARKTKLGHQVVVANLSEKEQKITIRISGQEKSLTLKASEITSLKIA